MKLFGSITELLQVKWRKNSQEITSRPNQSTTYTANRDIQLPPGDANHVLVSEGATQALTGKTIDADSNTISNIENADIKVGAGIDAAKIANGSVSNTEFQYLDGATSALQGQIDAKVTGPGSSTDEAFARFDSTTGKLVQNSSATMSDAGAVAGMTIDGDVNTVQDLPITAIKTVIGDANKVLRRDASGIPQSGNLLPNASEIVTLDATQSLSAKTVVDGKVDNFLDYEEQGSSPATPSSGYVRVFAKSDNKLYKKDDTGLESEIGAASGAGGINYISRNPDGTDGNSDAEDNNTTGWATYADAAASTPVDGTGGSANVTIASQNSNIIRGNYTFRLAKDAANRQGQGTSYDFKIDAADKGKLLQISFEVDGATSANYAENDIGIYIYDKDNAALITPSIVNVKKAKYTFQASFLSTTSDDYRIIFHVASTNASAYDLDFDNVSVGPDLVVQGVPVGPWTSFTPTGSWSTNTTYTGRYRRVGDTASLEYKIALAGAPTAAALTVNLPTGLTINTSAMAASTDTANRVLGIATVTDTSSYTAWVGYNSTTSLKVYAQDANITYSRVDDAVSNTIPSTLGSGDSVYIRAEVPIAEWAGSTISLDNTRVEYASNSSTSDADDTTSFTYGPAGSAIFTGTSGSSTNISKRVRFLNPIQDTDKLELQIQIAGTGPWVAIGDLGYSSDATVPGYSALTFQDNASGGANNRTYGMGLRRVSGSTTDIDIFIGKGGAGPNGVGYSATGANYPTTANDRYRVVKCSNPLSVAGSEMNRVQTKISATFSSGTGTAMTFNNLVIGKTYKVYMKASGKKGTSGTGNKAQILLKHNGVTLNYCGYENNDGVAANDFFAGVSAETFFTAAASTATIDYEVSGTGSSISGSTSVTRPDGTMATLTEINDSVITTAFT